MGKLLSKDERDELVKELKSDGSKREVKFNVILLLDDGYSYREISRLLFIDKNSIVRWLKKYQEGGIDLLLSYDYDNGTKRCKLSKEEEEELSFHLDKALYHNIEDVISYMEKFYGVRYTKSGATAFVHRLGFVYKKTKGVPGKSKKQAQLEFIKRLSCERKKRDIYFLDATHPTHNTVLSYAWIRKGKEREVLTSSAGRRINYIGAISIDKKKRLVRSYKTVNRYSVARFLKDLRKVSSCLDSFTVILDQASAHKSDLVQQTARELNIKLMYLPPYSPNLNPIERYWKFFKKNVLYNRYYRTFYDFQKACSSFFRTTKKYDKELSQLLTYNFPVHDST